MDEKYSNAHRAFLQACGRNGVLNLKQATDILASVQTHHGNQNAAADEAALRTMVTEINEKLNEREIEQRLNFVHFEWDDIDCDFLVLCNTFASVGQSPIYNEAECNYMKNIMEKIVTSEMHFISLMTAVHLCSSSSSSTQLTQSQTTSKKPMFCPNDDCETALDKRCYNSYVLKKNKCPTCKSNWEATENTES